MRKGFDEAIEAAFRAGVSFGYSPDAETPPEEWEVEQAAQSFREEWAARGDRVSPEHKDAGGGPATSLLRCTGGAWVKDYLPHTVVCTCLKQPGLYHPNEEGCQGPFIPFKKSERTEG